MLSDNEEYLIDAFNDLRVEMRDYVNHEFNPEYLHGLVFQASELRAYAMKIIKLNEVPIQSGE